MVTVIQSENHAANKGKTAGRYQFDREATKKKSKKISQQV